MNKDLIQIQQIVKAGNPLTSIIVPTFNGSAHILNTLNALENQSIKNFEVIVVVDGSEDKTEELLLSESSGFKGFTIITQTNKGRAAARNTGANAACGEILIFYDDDIRPEKDSVKKHLDFHSEFKKAIYGGNQIEDTELMHSDIQKYKYHLSVKWTAKYQQGLNKLHAKNLFVSAANMSIHKDLFNLMGGFDDRLRDAEDYDFAVRSFQAGIPVYFDKNNIAYHDDIITLKKLIQRTREYSIAHTKLVALKPEIYNGDFALMIAKISSWKKLLFLLFGNKLWVKLINGGITSWIPRFIRFRIYDWTLTALGRIYIDIPLE